jgi:hypothetical protein
MCRGELKLAINEHEIELNLSGLHQSVQQSIIENAVKEFFNDLEEEEKKETSVEKWEKGFADTYKQESTPTIEKPVQKKVFDGTKETPEGTLYQLFYICPNCRNKGKHYVDKSCIETFCHDCGYTMKPRAATDKGFGYQDDFNNYFIAGRFKRANEITWEYFGSENEDIQEAI